MAFLHSLSELEEKHKRRERKAAASLFNWQVLIIFVWSINFFFYPKSSQWILAILLMIEIMMKSHYYDNITMAIHFIIY